MNYKNGKIYLEEFDATISNKTIGGNLNIANKKVVNLSKEYKLTKKKEKQEKKRLAKLEKQEKKRLAKLESQEKENNHSLATKEELENKKKEKQEKKRLAKLEKQEKKKNKAETLKKNKHKHDIKKDLINESKKGSSIFAFNSKDKNNSDKNEIPKVHIDNNVEIKCVNVEKVVKELGGAKTVILQNIDLEINKGEITVILGPSGSGKTTLLNVIAGIDKATSGQVYIKDTDINSISDKKLVLIRRKYISYIYQRYGLIPILSCYDNIRLGQHLVEKNKRIIDINEVIKIVGIEALLDRFPHELSGGQRQRVAIARAIMKQPEVMLCDEPTAALDSETSKKIIDLFLEVNKKFNTTIVMVTHEPSFVKIATKVVYIKDGEIEKIETRGKANNQISVPISNVVDYSKNELSSVKSKKAISTINVELKDDINLQPIEENYTYSQDKTKTTIVGKQVEAFSTSVKVLDSKLNKEQSHVDEFIMKRKLDKAVKKAANKK